MDSSKLEADWMEVCSQWNCSASMANDAFLDLCQRYQHKSRFYHTLVHIENMLSLAEYYQSSIESLDAMFFAIWFHDSVQVIGKDNEQQSALLASRILKDLGVPEEIIKKVYSMILATKKHIERTDSDTKLLIDFDLAVLGSDRETYRKYKKNCRKEYAIPDWIFKRGRMKFLRKLLERQSIFQSMVFKERYEKTAIENIQRELNAY